MFLLKMIKKLIQLFLNFLFFVQIVIMMVVFFTAAYWFFSMANVHIFSFAEPLANNVINFMHLFYTPKVLLGDAYVDASLLLFDILALCLASFISFSKHYIYRLIGEIDILISKLKQFDEDKFNEELKKEAEAKILKSNNVAFLLEIELEDLLTKKLRNNSDIDERNLENKEKEAFNYMILMLKKSEDFELAKRGKKIFIFLKDFSKVDNVIFYIEQCIKKIRKALKQDGWEINYYISAEVYDNKTDFKTSVYPTLTKLMKLKLKDKVTCFGNFNLRYHLKQDPLYYIVLLNGTYTIDGGTDVYILVKKD